MKSVQKSIFLTVAILISWFAFSQVNRGVRNITSAVTNATVNVNAIKVKPVVTTAAASTKEAAATTTSTGAALLQLLF